MRTTNCKESLSKFMCVLCLSVTIAIPVGNVGHVWASESTEQAESFVEEAEDEITTRGIRGKRPRATMRRTQGISKTSSSGMSQQLAKLQQ